MKKDKKIILLSFATEDLKKTIKRLTVQATESGYYDEINILNPKNINSSNKNNKWINIDYSVLFFFVNGPNSNIELYSF